MDSEIMTKSLRAETPYEGTRRSSRRRCDEVARDAGLAEPMMPDLRRLRRLQRVAVLFAHVYLRANPCPLSTRNSKNLARSFAEQVVETIRGASLRELVSSGAEGNTGNGRTARVLAGGGAQPDSPSFPSNKPKGKNGRLPRRSPEQIAKTLDKIVLLVKTHKAGLRAEEIRSKLGMQAKEMPRILKEGLLNKKLASKGRKRATTYTAR